MRKNLLLITLLFSLTLFAQDKYRAGYYIDNQGNRVEGYLKSADYDAINDIGFRQLEFKTDLNQDAEKVEKFNVVEFGYNGQMKIQKMKAKIDNVNLNTDFGYYKEFTTKEANVFLKVLVEGQATLYSYDAGYGTKYLYKIQGKNDAATQLLYKKYLKSSNMLEENNTFRQQLFYNIKCEDQTYNDFLNVKYEENELVSLFSNFNKCQNEIYTVFKDLQKKTYKVNFSVLLGYNNGMFRVDDIQHPTDAANFGMISVGADAEIVFASDNASIFTSVEYKNAKGETEQTGLVSQSSPVPLRQVFRFDSYFVDVLVGARLYKKFGKSSTAFVGVGAGMNITSGTFETFQSTYTSPDLILIREEGMGGSPFVSFQLGYKFNKHYGIDVNYDTAKQILGNKSGQGIAKVAEIGLNLRYTF